MLLKIQYRENCAESVWVIYSIGRFDEGSLLGLILYADAVTLVRLPVLSKFGILPGKSTKAA